MRYSEVSGPVRMRLRALKSSLKIIACVTGRLSIAIVVLGNSIIASAQTQTEAFSQSIDNVFLQEKSIAFANTDDSPALMRRLYLSLVGIPPTLDELNSYLADNSPDRYAKAVDQLLSRPEFVEHWAERLDVMLMERRPNTNVPQDQWSQWLRDQVSSARPIHRWMADLIIANGTSDETRAVARFLLDRDGDPHAVTRDVGRIYFGRDMQCNQCHDHPAIDSYLQTDYHGLLAFMSAIKVVEVTEGEKKTKHIEERSASDAPFESVFKRGTMHRVLPHFFAATEVPQPWSIPGEEYQPPSAAGLPAKPIHSRRKQLADAIAQGNLVPFNRNLANRIWALVFGHGIIEPLDLVHADNPPLNEQLLTTATGRLVEDKFDLKTFVRDLVLTNAYRRGSLPLDYSEHAAASWLTDSVEPARARLASVTSSIAQLEATVENNEKAFDDALKGVAPLQAERLGALGNVDTARAAYTTVLDAFNKANAEKAAAEQAVATAKDKLAKVQTAVDSTGIALQALGTDAELSTMVEALKNRVAAITPTIAPLEQTFAEKTTLAQAAADAAVAPKASLLAAQQAADAVTARFNEAMVGVNAIRISMDNSRSELARAKADGSHLESVIAWSELQAKSEACKQERQQAFTNAETFRTQLANFEQQQKSLDEKLASLTTNLDAATLQQTNVRTRMNALEAQLGELATAKEKLISVSTLTKNPDSFTATFTELDNTTTSIQTDRTAVQQELSVHDTACQSCQSEIATLQQSISQLQVQRTALKAQLEAVQAQIAKSEAEISDLSSQSSAALQIIYHDISVRFHTTDLIPLSPEQIGWSALAVTGVYQNYINKHLGELEKESPSTEEQRADVHFTATRNAAAVRRARAELQGNINTFVSLYGAGAGQPQNEFFATADQALFTSNGGSIFAWSAPSGKNVTQRIVEATTAADAATQLYRGVLCRDPSAAEIQVVEQYLQQVTDNRSRMAQEMVWSLIASAEFRFVQ